MPHVAVVGKIIEHALAGNLDSVKAYGDQQVAKLREDGEDRQAQIIQDKLDGKTPDLVVVPVDVPTEYRLSNAAAARNQRPVGYTAPIQSEGANHGQRNRT